MTLHTTPSSITLDISGEDYEYAGRMLHYKLGFEPPSSSPSPSPAPSPPNPFAKPSPLPIEHFNDHNADYDDRTIDGAFDEDDHQQPDAPDEESGSDGSNFSEVERAREEKRLYKKDNARPHSPTAEERDEEDRMDEEEYLQDIGHCSPPQSKSRKGKANRRLSQREEDEHEQAEDENEDCSPTRSKRQKGMVNRRSTEEEDEHEQADDEDEDYRRSGPISQSVKDAAYRLHKDYITAMEELARSCGKPSKTLFRLVGDENPTPRPLIAWNAYQSWYSSCGEKKKPKDSKYFIYFYPYLY
jgi:hypothetical protein